MSHPETRHLIAAHRLLLEISSLEAEQQNAFGDSLVSLSSIVAKAVEARIPNNVKVATA